MDALVTGVQREDASGQLHALGKVEARQGEQVLSVVFYLTDDSQAGNPAGMQRWATALQGAPHRIRAACMHFVSCGTYQAFG